MMIPTSKCSILELHNGISGFERGSQRKTFGWCTVLRAKFQCGKDQHICRRNTISWPRKAWRIHQAARNVGILWNLPPNQKPELGDEQRLLGIRSFCLLKGSVGWIWRYWLYQGESTWVLPLVERWTLLMVLLGQLHKNQWLWRRGCLDYRSRWL